MGYRSTVTHKLQSTVTEVCLGKGMFYWVLEVTVWRQAWLTGVAYLILFRNIKEQGNKFGAQSWLGIYGLADSIYCISSQAEHIKEHKSLDFSHSPASRNSSISGLEIYFTILLPFLSFKRFDKKYWFSMTLSYYCLFRS